MFKSFLLKCLKYKWHIPNIISNILNINDQQVTLADLNKKLLWLRIILSVNYQMNTLITSHKIIL